MPAAGWLGLDAFLQGARKWRRTLRCTTPVEAWVLALHKAAGVLQKTVPHPLLLGPIPPRPRGLPSVFGWRRHGLSFFVGVAGGQQRPDVPSRTTAWPKDRESRNNAFNLFTFQGYLLKGMEIEYGLAALPPSTSNGLALVL